MSRSLSLGNGKMLILIDSAGQVRELYFPYVGLESHIQNSHRHRVGVFVDGEMHWLGSPHFDVSVESSGDAMTGITTAYDGALGITLTITDVVYNEKNILLRHCTVRNERDEKRTMKLFFGQEFQISESRRGDTAFFDPSTSAIIHYKGRRVFLINARTGEKSFDDYTVGLFEIEGREGSYIDAEDGHLSKNPVEHGLVDSVIGLTLDLEPKGEKEAIYWLAAGTSIEEVHDLDRYVNQKTPTHLLQTPKDFWNAWVNKRLFTFHGLTPRTASLFRKSLFLIRSHTDNRGGILASGDSDMLQHGRDTYSYVWPRDAAISAIALARAGEFNVLRRFLEFANAVITPEGYMMHKYRPDGSLGSSWHPWVRDGKKELPIQEDETALVLIAFRAHYDLTKDLEFVEDFYNPLIKRAGEFLVNYTHEKTGLPYPSYDLWEEQYGIATYTCAAKYGGLCAAAYFAGILGKHDEEKKFVKAAELVRSAMLSHLYDSSRGVFYKLALVQAEDLIVPDPTLDASSIYGVWRYGVLPHDDKKVESTIKKLDEDLLLGEGTIGGMPRYGEDNYFRSHNNPPNPWIITTLWRAQYLIAQAKRESDMDEVKAILEWVADRAVSKNSLPEQVHPYTGMPLSATPLVWSHAEFVNTVIDYLEKLEELGICDACYPVT